MECRYHKVRHYIFLIIRPGSHNITLGINDVVIVVDISKRVSVWLYLESHIDELGEITVTDKQLLLFLSLDTYAGVR